MKPSKNHGFYIEAWIIGGLVVVSYANSLWHLICPSH